MPTPSDFAAAQAAMTTAAAAGSDRKNLVVIFLAGGNCAHNTIIPRTGSNRGHYVGVRPGLAIADNPATALDADWQLHPALTGLKSLWDDGKLAIVRNVGPLVEPVTHAQYTANPITVRLPPQLYSHSDQQDVWETGIADQPVADTGWLGRLAELMMPFNAASPVTPLFTLSGPTDTFRAHGVRAIGLGPNGFGGRTGGFRLDSTIVAGLEDIYQTYEAPNPLVQEFLDSHKRAVSSGGHINAARDAAAVPTAIPDDGGPHLGNAMRMILRLASQQDSLDQRRSIFFVTHGGYDHHFTQLNDEIARFTELDPVLLGAYNASVNYGIDENTTFVVYSEFGRSMRQNGTGSDHGWGGHAFVFGGGVQGGWYGNPYSLNPAGPDLALSQCHLIPSTSVDTFIASIARWMGVPDATANGVNPLNLVVPNLPNFPTRNLNLFV